MIRYTNTIKNSECRKVVLSRRAYTALVAETYEHIQTETGGICLGSIIDGVWYVVEIIDPGPNSIFQVSYFEYDTPYVNHVANKVALLYQEPVELLGLWHRHPGSMDVFSSTDDSTHRLFVALRPEGAISALVNVDPKLRITMYHISPSLQYNPVEYVIGDEHIPKHRLLLKKREDIVKSSRPTMRALPSRRGEQLSVSEEVLSMIDTELPYLAEQREYSYLIAPQGNGVAVVMTYQGEIQNYATNLQFDFMADDKGQRVLINGQPHPYEVDIIKRTINDFITMPEPSSNQPSRRHVEQPSSDSVNQSPHHDSLSDIKVEVEGWLKQMFGCYDVAHKDKEVTYSQSGNGRSPLALLLEGFLRDDQFVVTIGVSPQGEPCMSLGRATCKPYDGSEVQSYLNKCKS